MRVLILLISLVLLIITQVLLYETVSKIADCEEAYKTSCTLIAVPDKSEE